MADFNGRIKKVKIKETSIGSNEYKTIVEVDDDYNNEVGLVQVEFQKDMQPAPNQNPVYCKPTDIKLKENGKREFENDSLSFGSKEANGMTVPVVVTMLNEKGEILGTAEKMQVTIGDNEDLQ